MNITTYKIHEVFLEVNKFISKKKKIHLNAEFCASLT